MSRKRVLQAVAALLVVLVLVVGLLWVFPVLRVSAFEVTGNARTPEELVVEATGVAEGDNLVRVDAGRAAAGVAQLPWARSATVSRGWPGTLQVEVTERRAVLFSREADGDHLVDDEGVPFVIDVPPEDAVEVTGEVESYGPVADVVTALPEDIRVLVSSVDVPGPQELTLRLADGRTVYWGASESNHDKALAVQTVLQREGQHWNVSNPAMVTVR